MARKSKSKKRAPEKLNSIPKKFIEEKVATARSEIEQAIDTGKEKAESDKTIRLLQEVMDQVNEDLNEILDAVDDEGIKHLEDQEEICEMAEKTATNGKSIISQEKKSGKGHADNTTKYYIRRRLNSILHDVKQEVGRKFKLSKRPVEPDTVEVFSPNEFLKEIANQMLIVFAQSGVNSMLQQMNKKKIGKNPEYFSFVKILGHFLVGLKTALADEIALLGREVIRKDFDPEKWNSSSFVSNMEHSLRLLCKSSPLQLHESVADIPEYKDFHTKLMDSFQRIVRGMQDLHGRKKLQRVKEQEEDSFSIEVLKNVKHKEFPQLYTLLRDKNIEMHGEYSSAITFGQLVKKEKDALSNELREYMDPETEIITIPDLETEELICAMVNDLVDTDFLLPEDIQNMVKVHNELKEKEMKESQEAEKEQIKQLFTNKLYKYIESLALRFARIIKSKISQSKHATGSKFVPISKEEYEAVRDLFEEFKKEVFEQIEDLVNNHFENDEDSWKTKDTDILEAMLSSPLRKKLVDFCSKLEKMGIEDPDPKFFDDNINGISINVQEIVNDVNNQVEPDTVREEPNIEDLVLRTMLLTQAPKDQQNENYFVSLDFDDSEKDLINGFFDVEVEPEILKVEEVESILTDLEKSGVIKMLAQRINDTRYCGMQIRDASQIRDIAFEYLTNKKRELREVKKGVVELTEDLQRDLDEALKWVEKIEWAFGDEPKEFGLEKVAKPLPDGAANKKSSYPKVAWAHYMHLRNRSNMPVHIIEQHVKAILAIKTVQKSDGGFNVKLYEKDNRNSASYWLDSTTLPYRKEDQRTSPKVDRLDAHISVLQKKKEELEDKIGELEPLNARIAQLKQDILDLTNEIVDCDSAVDGISKTVSVIRSKMAEMLQAGESMKEVNAKGKEAEAKEKEKDPIIKNKATIQTRITEKEKRISELEEQLAELPDLQKDLKEIEKRLEGIESKLDEAFDLAKI